VCVADTKVVGVPLSVVALLASPVPFICKVQLRVEVSGSITVKIVVKVEMLVMPPFPNPFMEEITTLVGGRFIVKFDEVEFWFPAVSFAYTVTVLFPLIPVIVVLPQAAKVVLAPPFREYQQVER
jgi:hypothetical protein